MEMNDTYVFLCILFLAIMGFMICYPRSGIAEMFGANPLGAPEPSKQVKKKKKRPQQQISTKSARIIRQPVQDKGTYDSAPVYQQQNQQNNRPVYTNQVPPQHQLPEMQVFNHTRSGEYQSQPTFAIDEQGRDPLPGVPPRDSAPMVPQGMQESFHQQMPPSAMMGGSDGPSALMGGGPTDAYNMTPNWQPDEPAPCNSGGDVGSPW